MTHARRIPALLAVVFFGALGACTSQPAAEAPSPTPVSIPSAPAVDVDRFCHQPDEGQCHSARLTQGYEEESEELRCQQANGTWDSTPCDTSNLVGRCVAANRRGAWYFSPPRWTETTARAQCATLGDTTWMPGDR